MMSSVETWTKRDGKFDLEQFWKNIVRLFERADEYGLGDWANNTLDWFTRYVLLEYYLNELTTFYVDKYLDCVTMESNTKMTPPRRQVTTILIAFCAQRFVGASFMKTMCERNTTHLTESKYPPLKRTCTTSPTTQRLCWMPHRLPHSLPANVRKPLQLDRP